MVGIKSMKMPKCCSKCNFKYYDEDENVLCCALEDGYIPDDEVDEKRLECCPLVEIEDEESQDGVSRAVVLQLINDVKLANGFNEYSQYEYLFDQVDKMPSVASTRKKGKWEHGYSFPDGNYAKCTACGEIIKCTFPMHFCPNCGAEMREAEE